MENPPKSRRLALGDRGMLLGSIYLPYLCRGRAVHETNFLEGYLENSIEASSREPCEIGGAVENKNGFLARAVCNDDNLLSCSLSFHFRNATWQFVHSSFAISPFTISFQEPLTVNIYTVNYNFVLDDITV